MALSRGGIRRRVVDELLTPTRNQLECLRLALGAGEPATACRRIHQAPASSASSSQVEALKALIPSVAAQNPSELGQEARERQNASVVGTAWAAATLRKKSFDELHSLWLMLYKERNALHAEKLAWKRAGQRMPQATRLSKTRLSMNRIKQVMGERSRSEAYSEEERGYLKAFVDSM